MPTECAMVACSEVATFEVAGLMVCSPHYEVFRAHFERHFAVAVLDPRPVRRRRRAATRAGRRRPLRMAVNLEHKLGLPDYSSVSASAHISGITVDMDDAEVVELAEKGKVAWSIMGPRVTAQARAAARKKGWEVDDGGSII